MIFTLHGKAAHYNPSMEGSIVAPAAKETGMGFVTDIPPASPEAVKDHFLRRLSVETDCADVAAALRHGDQDFVLLHVVGSPDAYSRRHVPGALHLPHREISPERMAEWPMETLFVVYCAGPHCNGADQAAYKLANLGRPAKVMIGGITGWADEGLTFASGPEPEILR